MTLFDPTQPQDLPPPNIAVDQIRANFSQYATVFGNNHVPINSTFQGKHTNVLLQGQISDPIVDGSFDSLFAKFVILPGNISQELFVTIPQFLTPDKPNIPMQMTFNKVSLVSQYQSFLIGGYLIYWDTIPSAATVAATISLVPAPSEILCVIPNPTRLNPLGSLGPNAPQRISITILNNSQFRINAQNLFPGGTGKINWVAIARQ